MLERRDERGMGTGGGEGNRGRDQSSTRGGATSQSGRESYNSDLLLSPALMIWPRMEWRCRIHFSCHRRPKPDTKENSNTASMMTHNLRATMCFQHSRDALDDARRKTSTHIAPDCSHAYNTSSE